MRQHVWRREGWLLLALAFVAFFTLRPSPRTAEMVARVPWTCLFPCGDNALRDTVLNIVLFVPLGLALRSLLPTARALAVILLATVAIEAAQHLWLVGRDPSLRDVLSNTAGGGLGLWLATHWRRLLDGPAAWNQPLAALAGGGWVVLLLATSLLVQPSLPRSRFWGQWAPELGQFDVWQGTLLDATVNRYRLPEGKMYGGDLIRDELLSDSVLVGARIVAGPPPLQAAPIASVFDSVQRGIFVLGQRRENLVFMIRTGLRRVELGEQWVSFPAFTGRQPGDTMTVWGGVIGRAWVLRAEYRGAITERRVPMSPGLMWSALLPFFFVLGPATALFSAGWLALTIAPAGYFTGRASPAVSRLALALAIAAVCLTASARMTGLGIPPVWEYAGTAAGLVAGWLAGRALPRRA